MRRTPLVLTIATQRLLGKRLINCGGIKFASVFLHAVSNCSSTPVNQVQDKAMADDPENKVPRYPPVSPEMIEKWDLVQNELKHKVVQSDTEDWQQTEELHKYKIPEPIRFADNISREFVRKMENEESQSQKT